MRSAYRSRVVLVVENRVTAAEVRWCTTRSRSAGKSALGKRWLVATAFGHAAHRELAAHAGRVGGCRVRPSRVSRLRAR